jgi:hypothetical protein
MSKDTVFVVSHNRRDFTRFVDTASNYGFPEGQRFAFVQGVHSLYGVDLTPQRMIFTDGWEDRDDAAAILESVTHRLALSATR